MDLKQIIPRRRVGRSVPLHPVERDPFLAIRDEMNRIFDNFFYDREVGLPDTAHIFTPSMDVHEDEKEIVISTELPGLDESQVDVSFEDDMLTVKGEKREEEEQKDKNYYRMERRYGSFRRSLRLPDMADPEKAQATFKNGVLRIQIPKKEESQIKRKKIDIKPG